MKDKISMEVVAADRNAELLAKVPHQEMEDMAVVYRFVVESDEAGRATILVTNELLDKMGVTPEQLHADALENAPELRPAVIKGMSEVMVDMMGPGAAEMFGIDEFPQDEMMYVATVPDKISGAGVIAYQEFMDQAAERLGGDFYILPSSVHEVLLVKDDGNANFRDLKAMVLSYTSIEEISIPQSVVHIGYSAFSNSKLKEVELPHNLYSIEKYAFDIPSLSKITIHSNVKIISEDIFGMRGKAVKPTIYCSAGSKGLLYARKYGLNCSEIPAQPSVNVQVCSSSIILVLGSLTKGENIAEWYRYFGMNKAETWSWTAKYWNTLYIEKCMDMDDALRIRRTIQNFVNTHSDWSRPGIRCSLQELSVCEHWGQSAV